MPLHQPMPSGPAAAPRALGVIEETINNNASEIVALQAAIEELERRLAPVMRHPATANVVNQKPDDTASMVVAAIRSQSERIYAVRERVNSIAAALDT